MEGSKARKMPLGCQKSRRGHLWGAGDIRGVSSVIMPHAGKRAALHSNYSFTQFQEQRVGGI